MKLSKSEKNKIAEIYCKNNLSKLRAMIYPLVERKKMLNYYDELLDQAMFVLTESLNSYDDEKNCKFYSYFYGNILRGFYDWTRDNMRWKRCNLEKDNAGKIKKDSQGIPVVIQNISLDANYESGNIREKIPSDFDLFKVVFENDFEGTKMEKYLQKLSILQRKIVSLLSEDFEKREIIKILHITEKQYAENLDAIQAYENVRELM